ncbi:MAG: hypothetical protein HKN16_12220 [Saprospiraceae bacterium]|nr:hypothetical protein [Saprospiraceae bacterium]
MKTFLLSLILCITIQIANGQSKLTTSQWQEDLEFLQKTIHDDYSFLFKKTSPEKLNAAVKMLHKEIPDLEDHQIIVGLAKIVSLFEYGHTSIGLSGWRERTQFDFHQMSYNLKQFSDGVFIQGTTTQFPRALGAKVLKIEGTDVDKVIETVRPIFPTENYQFFKAYGMSYLGNPEILHAAGITKELKKQLTLTLEKDGKIFDQTFEPIKEKKFPGQYTFVKEEGNWLDARDNSRDPLYLKHLDKIYFYEHLTEDNAVYIRHSQIQDDPEENIPAFYDRVFKFVEENEVEKLILDVRLNGGGNNYKNKPIVTNILRSRINKPGKLFVITGGHTFSACQNLVNELDNYTEAIFVGEPTGENINFYGDNRRVNLPNSNIPVFLSFAWWQDKPQWENDQWLAPHLAVESSFKQYTNNEDPALETILGFTSENFILDPMSYLTELYQSGQNEKLQTESVRMINDPAYKFFDFEDEFNQLGYDLLGRGDAQTAVAVFGFITQLFPDSANAWDSLAEASWKSGDKEQAIQLYNKAISMDPDGTVGDNAREMLKKIEAEK